MKPADVLAAVGAHYGLKPEDLLAGRRTKLRTWGRHLSAYLLRRSGRYSLSDIARALKYGDHTAVVGALQRVRRELEENPRARDDLAAVADALDLTLGAEEPRRVMRGRVIERGPARPLFPAGKGAP